MRCSICVLLGLAACSPAGRSPTTADAASDATFPEGLPPPRNDLGPAPWPAPFDAAFVTPAGSFDAKFLYAQAIWGDCNPPYWELRFSGVETGAEPNVNLYVTMPPYTGVEVSGPMAASASYWGEPLVTYSTQHAVFYATRLDYPANGAPRITGRFVVSDPAWTIDLDIDALALSSGCI